MIIWFNIPFHFKEVIVSNTTSPICICFYMPYFLLIIILEFLYLQNCILLKIKCIKISLYVANVTIKNRSDLDY